MGELLKQLSRYVSFSDDSYQAYFEEALRSRNFLIHRILSNGMRTSEQRRVDFSSSPSWYRPSKFSIGQESR
jgi:hypothetical protein